MLGIAHIGPFIPTILLSFLFFSFIHLVVAPWLCNRLWPLAYASKKRSAQNSWEIHIVSQVHCVVIIAAAAYSVWTESPDRALDQAFGWSDTTGYVHGIAVGYFLWDTVDAIVNYIYSGFVVHGVVCLLIYAMTFRPFAAYYGTRCLLWEISTFFLNIHWILDKTGKTGSKLQLVNGILLISSFLFFRLIYGGSVCFSFFLTLTRVWREIPLFYTIVFGTGIFTLQGLNLLWFTKMIIAMRRRFESKPDESAALLNASS
ncbi:hypothetical protein AGABI1DRAFT_68152 [Agaricus bisporus var. burnettii JB137-S8]|uniref:TLC domain-containing protein n=1 Tax=Agaricus bisporus var. burnettii (strain JB137-S8 / ATCC MYA-4627 / FGSC 10392) TaxID=597362 RepID=K5XGT3_AGABU|nr:uncharacterized protein AGABI1DRAFT_68152 [Agaricus bisporus var. burnettii JB137-S8]EKM82492.1 hypothetical protein AGABI1DRAFT_68152 [Agaricus bisporus var. burnettii JB137-S8]